MWKINSGQKEIHKSEKQMKFDINEHHQIQPYIRKWNKQIDIYQS